jgi:gliding motility-associated-like protein
LKKILHILLLLLSTALAGQRVQAQDTNGLPWACSGSEELYWVKGFNGVSNFEWRVFFNQGENRIEVTDEILSYHNQNGDSVKITWPTSAELGGIYTFEVVETTAYGCIGTVYEQDIIVNSSTIITESFFDDAFIDTFFACEGGQVVIDPGATFFDYLWQDGSTDQTFITTEAGTFQVRLKQELFDSENRPLQFCSFAFADAEIHPLPEIDLGKDTTLFGAENLTLYADGIGIREWDWFSFDYNNGQWNENVFNRDFPSFSVEGGTGDQWIAVWVTDLNGCVNSDSIKIKAADYEKFRIPAAFIPGSNNANNRVWNFPAPLEDGGEALYQYLNDVQVRVFNRWGGLVWESEGMYQPWDGRDKNGRPLPMDSYHYIIRIKVDGKVFLYKGSVTIIR